LILKVKWDIITLGDEKCQKIVVAIALHAVVIAVQEKKVL